MNDDAQPSSFVGDDLADAFAAVVQAYQSPIYNLCFRMLGETSAAEDATQETFLRAYHHLAGYDRQRPLQTWLFSIASHHCIDRLRRLRPIWLPVDDETLAAHEPAPGPEGMVLRHELRDQIQELLGCLSRATGARLSCATGMTSPTSRSQPSWARPSAA